LVCREWGDAEGALKSDQNLTLRGGGKVQIENNAKTPVCDSAGDNIYFRRKRRAQQEGKTSCPMGLLSKLVPKTRVSVGRSLSTPRTK